MKRSSIPTSWRYVAAGLAISVAGAFGVIDLASAHSRPDMPPAGTWRGGPGMGMAGAGLPLGGPMLDRLLDDVQASDAQRDQLHRIAETAQADLKPTADAARADHARMVELFAQPSVDAAAVESLRQKMLARHDQVTRRVNVAMLDAAKVLTPEQRQQMAERMRQFEQRRSERGDRDGERARPDMPPR
ncbi:Spy/CpxP family protein refolding chaperone [Ideonella sp. YS5]|uniref:Spy/CpxP family protein refolding chaperone n=1 Tax=Ideonella sp. YS5 TaxID=3453714 RepID=UPI003EE8564B